MSARELARAIRIGETTSSAVVHAHIERLRDAAGLNALAADRFQAALEEADSADRRVTATPVEARDSLPPLLGVPCTIKESIAVEGMPNCAGVVHRREVRAERSAPVVERLGAAGAIPLGVTNLSELTMWIESENRVYGRTRNAYDHSRSAGGSSGGEGAAIGCGGSPFGIGSDMGGSIRLPAYFNGVFGHKPTSGIVPNTGQWPFDQGASARMVGIGPLARRAEDLIEVLRIIAGPDGEDPRTRRVALGDPAAVEIAGLDVVVATRAWLTPVRPAVLRTRDRAAEALKRAGARIRVEPMPGLRRAMELYLAALEEWSDGTAADLLTAEGDPALRLRDLWRRRSDHTPATALLLAGELSGRVLPWRRGRRLIAAVESLRDEVLGPIGDGVLLHPPYPGPVPRHRRTVGRPWVLGPSAAFNLLGLPATEIPLGLGRDGMPRGVQAIAAPDRDHVTIAVACELERAFGGWIEPEIFRPRVGQVLASAT
jgi:fatty acid amide hydrolase 2